MNAWFQSPWKNSPQKSKPKKKRDNQNAKKKTGVWEALFERNLRVSCRRNRPKMSNPSQAGVLDCPQLLASVRTTVSWLESSQLHSVLSLLKKKQNKWRNKKSSTRWFIFHHKELRNGTVKSGSKETEASAEVQKRKSWRSFSGVCNARPVIDISPRSTVGHKSENGGKFPTHAQSRLIQCGRLIQVSTLLFRKRKKKRKARNDAGMFQKVSRFKCLHCDVKERTENGTVFGSFFHFFLFVCILYLCPCGVSYVSAMCQKSSNRASKISQAPLSLKNKRKKNKAKNF